MDEHRTAPHRPCHGVTLRTCADFTQNEPGWCKLSITGQRGLAVQLRHAEILQHPPCVPVRPRSS